jgi:hypothetical protein
MRRTSFCLGLAAALSLTMMVGSAAAAPKAPTGTRISLTGGGPVQTFGAGDAFYISHGHLLSIDGGQHPALGKYGFTLEVDGDLQAADFKRIAPTSDRELTILWTFNFPDGMTGVHEFTGRWYAPCDDVDAACGGFAFGTIVEIATFTSVVTFE